MLIARLFVRAKRGAAAVEFAFIAPILALMFFGVIELSEGLNARQRMESVASTTSDLVAQSTSINTTGINNVFAAANTIMYPYPANIQITLSSLQDDPANSLQKALVVWSKGNAGATTRSVGEVLTVGGTGVSGIPTGVVTAGGTVIYAEVKYTFQPVTHYVLGGSVTMQTKFFSRPRRSVAVSWSNS